MPITINGTGTIAGITAGGLPDGSITNDDLAGSIDDAKLSGTTCRAWVNFNGTGTVAIRAQYNVSSITDNGVGDYTVNFATALVDANYGFNAFGYRDTNYTAGSTWMLSAAATSVTSSSLRIVTYSHFTNVLAANDVLHACVSIFR